MTDAAEAIDHLNTDHADTVAFVARVMCDRPSADDGAALVGLDLTGIDVRHADGTVDRIAFPAPAADPAGVQPAMMALVRAARERSGEEGETSVERELREVAHLGTYVGAVTAVAEVHAGLRRVTIGGPDLGRLHVATPDAFLYLLLPPPGRTELTVGTDFTWDLHAAMPEEDRPVGAYYTVWEWRADVREVDLLMVLHGDEGPASAWAARAQPGDPVALWGPRSSFDPPVVADRWLVCADETATPAAVRVLQSRPAGVPAVLLAETADAAHRQPLPDLPGVEVRWLERGTAAPGTTTLLRDALAALAPSPADFVWGAGEHHAVADLRAVCGTALVPRTHRSLLAYWRRST